MDALDALWRPLIAQAAAWRPGAPMVELDATLDFMREALARAGVMGDSFSAP
jgi:hypothetical protein